MGWTRDRRERDAGWTGVCRTEGGTQDRGRTWGRRGGDAGRTVGTRKDGGKRPQLRALGFASRRHHLDIPWPRGLVQRRPALPGPCPPSVLASRTGLQSLGLCAEGPGR